LFNIYFMGNLLLDHSWYYKHPIDFEHKQWTLFAYLQKVDEAFYSRIFSPWLLHTEKLCEDMKISLQYLESFKKGITKKSVLFSFEGIQLVEQKPVTNKEVDIVEEIVKFSIPLLDQRVSLGRKLHSQYPTILYDKEL
jgi:hypothetical protein